MIIRILNHNDLYDWKCIRLEALKNNPDSFLGSYEDEVTYNEDEWLKQFKKGDLFGAFDNKKLVAVAGFEISDYRKKKHTGVIFSLYTTPLYRGKGIAGALVDAIISHARSRVMQINLGCITTNTQALNLYHKKGFKIYGTEPNILKVGETFLDAHWMYLLLK